MFGHLGLAAKQMQNKRTKALPFLRKKRWVAEIGNSMWKYTGLPFGQGVEAGRTPEHSQCTPKTLPGVPPLHSQNTLPPPLSIGRGEGG